MSEDLLQGVDVNLLMGGLSPNGEERVGIEMGELGETHTAFLGRPEIYAPEWTDYVMGHFQPNELKDGHPSVNGLRRVAAQLVGTITNSYPDVIDCPNENNNHGAVVKYMVTIDSMHAGREVTFGGAADVSRRNTHETYCKHAVATAESKAEGRALRKALMLNILSAEELIPAASDEAVPQELIKSSDTINSAQRAGINMLCKNLKISVDRLLGGQKIDEISYDRATELMKQLNLYQRQEVEVPSELIVG